MQKKIISLTICILFVINNIVYPLGVAPGTQNPQIVDAFEATGKKLFAAKWEECPVDFESYIRPEEFVGEPKDLPQGVSVIRRANYKDMPESWKESAFFREILYKNDNYKNIQFGEIEDMEKLLVDAFKYYRNNEANIPAGLVDVKIRNFPVKEEKGEIPISRIEKYKNGKYALIIHPKFSRMWCNLLQNDKWIKYDDFVDKNNPKKGKQTRYASLAWGIFYRIAKHEMTDLDGKTKQPKKELSSHLTWYEGEMFDGGGILVEKKSEIDANRLGGNYAEINDAMWLWFLGSYCFGDPTRYDNSIFEKRIDWIFTNPKAKEKNLNDEFPRLRGNTVLRNWAKSLALNINFSYFSGANGKIQDVGRMKRKQKNNYIFYKIIAGYIVNSMKKHKKDEQKSLGEVLKIIQKNLPEYIYAGFRYSIDNKGVNPGEISDIEDKIQENIKENKNFSRYNKLKKIDKELERVLMLLAIKIINKTIENNVMGIQGKIVEAEEIPDVSQYVKEALYNYFGVVDVFYYKNDAIRAIEGFIEGYSREPKVVDSFSATGMDDSETDRLDAIFSIIVLSDQLRNLMKERDYFTIRNLLSVEDIDFPNGYTRDDAERDLDALVDRGEFSSKMIENEKRYYRTYRGAKAPGEIWAVEKGILDKNVSQIFSSEEAEFLKDNKVNTIRELVSKRVDEVRAFRVGIEYSDYPRNPYIDSIENKLELLRLNLGYPDEEVKLGFVLDLRIKNLHPKIKKPLRLNMIAAGIVNFRDIISRTENDLMMIKGMTRENVKDIVSIIGVMGLSLKPVNVYIKKKDKRRKPGRSPEDALAVIEKSEYIKRVLSENGYFTLIDYRKGYNEVRDKQIRNKEKIIFAELPKKENDSQSRRDLEALVKSGRLSVDRTGKPFRYFLSGKIAREIKTKEWLKEFLDIIDSYMDVESGFTAKDVWYYDNGALEECFKEGHDSSDIEPVLKEGVEYGLLIFDEETHKYFTDKIWLDSAKRDLDKDTKHWANLEIQSKIDEFRSVISQQVITQLTEEKVNIVVDKLDQLKELKDWIGNGVLLDKIAMSDRRTSGEMTAYLNRRILEERLPFELIVAIKQSAKDKTSQAISKWFEKIIERLEKGRLDTGVVKKTVLSIFERLSNDKYSYVNGLSLETLLTTGLYVIDTRKLSVSNKKLIDDLFLKLRSVEVNKGKATNLTEDKTLEEVISEYILNVKEMFGDKVMFELNEEQETAIKRTVNLAHETNIEILIPAASIKIAKEMNSAIERMNKIMSQNGSKISVNEYYGPANFFRHLADKKDGSKKIVIIDGQTSKYMNEFCQGEISMSEMDKFEIFRNVRMLNVLDLDPASEVQNGAVYQTQLLMTAILARLIEEGDDHFLDIKSLLMELLDGTFLNGGIGRVKMDEFINNLAEREDETTSFDRIRNKVKYFVSEGRAISLIRTLQREIRMMQYFWTFA